MINFTTDKLTKIVARPNSMAFAFFHCICRFRIHLILETCSQDMLAIS